MSVLFKKHLWGASLLALFPAATYAQTQDTEIMESVVITGSLLGAGANFTAPTPVTAVSSLEVQQRALTGIGTVIGELPYAQPGVGLDHNTGGIVGASQSTIDLRGLGSNRTLVLIDGQRPAPVNATNNFDTNLIPGVLVDRFDVVTGGASASYGSDAVAGVVNFILKKQMEGFTANVQYGISQRGDTHQAVGSLAWGTAFAGGRGHFIIGGEVAAQYETVNMYARDWGRDEPGIIALTATRAAGLPANVWTNHVQITGAAQGGLITSGPLAGIAFGDNGVPYQFPYGDLVGSAFMQNGGNYGVSDIGRQLSPPYKRSAALARVSYDVTPSINAYLMVNYGQLESGASSQGVPFPAVFTIKRENPYLPQSIQDAMDINGLTTITVAKQTLNGNIHYADNKNTLLQTLFGISGTLFDDWSWDLQGNAGRSIRWQGFNNVPVTANMNAAVDAISDPITGNPICRPTATATTATLGVPYPGCVPYNIFGPNEAPREVFDYIMNAPDGNDVSQANIRQYAFNADLKGVPFTLPAGDFYTAFGANWRYNSYRLRSNPAAQTGVFATQNPKAWGLSQETYEFYGEVGVPLIKDVPFIQSLDLNAAGRYTNYEISGGVKTWKYGATWDVNDWLRFRATMSADIRAPNFQELTPISGSSGQNLTNPANGVSIRTSNVFSSGNPNLVPEQANNFTAGVVIQPTVPWLQGLRVSVDYFRISIHGVISSPSAQTVIDRCYAGINEYCSMITFDSSAFGIARVDTSPVNADAQLEDGFDINIKHTLPIDEWFGIPGALDVSALGTYVNQKTIFQTVVLAGVPTVIARNDADTSDAPRWAWNVTLTHRLDRFTGALQARYYSPIKLDTSLIGPEEAGYSPTLTNSVNRNIWPASWRWNLRFSYDVIKEDDGRNLQAYLNIDNIFDTDPPVIWSVSPSYDVVGRYFKVGVRYTMP